MKFTDELKKEIDDMSYEEMLKMWRFAHVGHWMFIQSENPEENWSSGYFIDSMIQKSKKVNAAAISKKVGFIDV